MNKKTILAFLVIVITILLTIIMISNLEKENKEKIVIHSPPTPTLTSMPISTAIPTIIPTSAPIETSTPVPTAMPTPSLGKYLGEFKITGYTASPSENGGYTVSGRFEYQNNIDKMTITQYCTKRSIEIKNK